MSKNVYEENEVTLAPLAGRRVAVLGYGNQGRAQARNLRDSGIEVEVGARSGGRGHDRAHADGFTVLSLPEAAAHGDVVMMLLPDEIQGLLWKDQLAGAMKPDAALGFSHGFAVAFDQIAPPDGMPCFLVAPKGQGDMLREAFAKGGGLPGMLAVTDGSPEGPEHESTWELAAAYAKAIGCLRGGGFRTTFREECVADQFGEQAVLCGGLIELVRAAFDTLVSRGYHEDNAYFECVHEVKLIADLLHRHGLDGMRRMISPTAAYGGLTRGRRLVDDGARERMNTILDEIESGAFAREFLDDAAQDDPEAHRLARAEAESRFAAAGRKLRARLDALGLDGPPEQGGKT
ncbi:ketol-acid reductoisomerase [bacterium]|nr:ketol-acid reductoisomerase [bacterium]